MKRNFHSLLFGAVALLIAFGAPVPVLAQIDVGTGPGSEFHYVYNPREAGEFPSDALDGGGLQQLAFVAEGDAAGTAYLHSYTGQDASVTWHYRLTDPNAVWATDAHVRADVLLIADAAAERTFHYWLFEYSTDGEEFFPFFSSGHGDAGQPYFYDFSGAHSERGPFFLDRGGFEGGSRDLYVRITAVNGWSEGIQMQAFRTDADNNRQFEFRASILGEGEAQKVSVTTQEAVALDMSPDDSLNGIVGTMSAPLHFTSAGGENNAAFFTNATSPTAPTGNVFWHPDNNVYHITWDLGDAVDPQQRQLDELSVWIDAHDDGRRGYRGSFYASTDGGTFIKIPGSYYSDRLAQGGTGGSPLYNNVRYTFEPGHATGFRYLRFVSYGIHLGQAFIGQPRFVEIDAFVSTVDAPPPDGGFAEWRAQHFPDHPGDDGVSGPGADPDGDGIPNIVEYALGLNPNAPDRSGLPEIEVAPVTVNGSEALYLTLTYRRPAGIDDIEYTVSTAGALGDWQPNAERISEDEEAGTVTVVYRDVVPADDAGRRFMRLDVALTAE